jgi:hypothetical protein
MVAAEPGLNSSFKTRSLKPRTPPGCQTPLLAGSLSEARRPVASIAITIINRRVPPLKAE